MTEAKPAANDDAILPEVLPIFPLSGVLLLPRAELPLHIFEARYRAMTRDALAGSGLIGMIQPKDPHESGDAPAIYPTGCMGRIADCRQTDDGRYYMTLVGICRFRIREELPLLEGYRRVVPDYAPFSVDLVQAEAPKVDRERLLTALAIYCERRKYQVNWDVIKKTADGELVSALAMLCPFEPSEKQALLECGGTEERSRVLVALLEMALLSRDDDKPVKH